MTAPDKPLAAQQALAVLDEFVARTLEGSTKRRERAAEAVTVLRAALAAQTEP